MTRVQGGYNLYGRSIGILMLQTRFPRIPGDMGNATSFPFPVVHSVVETASKVVAHSLTASPSWRRATHTPYLPSIARLWPDSWARA